MKQILIISPHADDEILGCGATIKKHVNEGDNVYVLIMTNANIGDPNLFPKDGLENTRKEALESHAFLGVKKTIFFDFPAPALDQYPKYKMSAAVAEIMMEYKIQTVYIPWHGDLHIDHQITYDISLVSCRPVGDYTVTKILAYETLSETEWASPFAHETFIPNVFVPFTAEEFEIKLEAMKFYASQLRSFPASRSLETMTALAVLRGSTINKERAEAFMLIRDIDI